MVSVSELTHTQEMYVRNIDLYKAYTYFDTQTNNVRLQLEGTNKSLTISKDDLVFLINNQLINTQGFEITNAGEIIKQPDIEHRANTVEIIRIRKELEDLHKIEHERLIEQQRKELTEQQKIKQQEDKRRAQSIIKCITGLFSDFKSPSVDTVNRRSRATTKQLQPDEIKQVDNVQAIESEKITIKNNNPNLSIALNDTETRKTRKTRLQEIMSRHDV